MEQPFIRVHIETASPVELSTFVSVLTEFSKSYAIYAKRIGDTSSQLLVKEVSKGSYILDMIEKTATLVSSLVDFVPSVKKAYDTIKGEEGKDDLTIKELKQAAGVAGLIKIGDGAHVTISTYNIGTDKALNTLEINEAQGAECLRYIQSRLNTTESGEKIHTEQLLFFHQMSKADTRSGCKGIIEAISPTPVNVTFTGDTKNRLMESVENPFKKAHLVDVVVQTIKGRPANYKIIAYHSVIDANVD